MKEKDIKAVWKGEPRCKECAIRHLVLFADLNEDDFTHIHHPIDMVESYAGDALYHPEDHARHIYTVREGLVKLVQYLPDGTQRIVRLLKQGDVAGIEATLNKPYQHEAIVLDDALVCRIPVKVITDLSQSTPRLHKSLMEKWSSAVMEADQWLTELSTGTSKERVARLLLKLNEITPADRFTMPSREDIGSMLGITTETASRIIAEFKRNEFIKSCPNKKAIASVADLTGILNK